MSNFVLKFSYQVKGNSSGSRLMDRGRNCVITLRGWFSLKFIRAWFRVYFPMGVGQDARVSGLWFLWRCFFRLPWGWLRAQCVRKWGWGFIIIRTCFCCLSFKLWWAECQSQSSELGHLSYPKFSLSLLFLSGFGIFIPFASFYYSVICISRISWDRALWLKY